MKKELKDIEETLRNFSNASREELKALAERLAVIRKAIIK